MDPQVELAFKFASDLNKQLITLATGILALTVTFIKDALGNEIRPPRCILIAAWVLYLLSIVLGVVALTGLLAPTAAYVTEEIRITGSARVATGLQILVFLAATSLIIWFGAAALTARSGKALDTPPAAPTSEASEPNQ